MRPRSRLLFARWAALVLVAAGALSVACGGSPASEAKSPEATAEPETATESQSTEVEPAEVQAPAPRCDDGTCFECGEGLCPPGFYCDRDASGGPACSWVPDCAKKPTCACLLRTLGKSCSCDDSGGGPSVTCQ